ncbi:MAG TPA: hypothetical protein VJ908_12790 [Wenzhouxiangellaceae bacterium]|nr:hypothetical protein [Wenzhouxiangellaceae bacterium]
MNFLRLLPVIVSFALLAAHFYRAQLPLLVAICAFLPLLLFLRRPWVPRLFQALLVIGALEWLRTLYMLAAMRIGFDQPWGRLALILGAVALFTAFSGLAFNGRSLRVRYRRPRIGGSDRPARP